MATAPEQPNLVLPKLMRLIEVVGPVSIAAFMAEANGHYYATRIPFGADADFITSPEISQTFGELIGLWVADQWYRAGRPAEFHLVEIGPGRGTLMADALRAMAAFGCAPGVHFIENSPLLRAEQAKLVPHAVHHDDLTKIPKHGPLVIITNEFFDALPIRQLVATHSGWRERVLGRDKGQLVALPGSVPMDMAVPGNLARQQPGTIFETSPASAAVMADCAHRIARQGGSMLVIDYGYEKPQVGNTLQAVRSHQMVDPFVAPGECDLTAHVDFSALADAARANGLTVTGPVGQGDWLLALGIDGRTEALIAASPDQADALRGQRDRLVLGGDGMGELFRVMACHSDGWPEPDGFA